MSIPSFFDIVNRVLSEEYVDAKEENGKFSDEEKNAAIEKLNSLEKVPKHEIFFKNPDKDEVFLKDVGFGSHGRVYHLEDGDKAKIRRVRIDLEGIGKGQPTAQIAGIQRAIEIAAEKDTNKEEKVPMIVKENGTYYVQDGHHRVCAHLLAGRKSMVVDMTEKRGDKFYVPDRFEDRI